MKNMLNTNQFANRMMDRMFRRVDNVVWDMMTGQIGVKNRDNAIITRGPLIEEDNKVDFELMENLFESFAMPIPAFAQATNRSDVKLGDMIVMASNRFGWITAIKERSFSIKLVDGSNTSWSPTVVNTLGGTSDSIMVVRHLMDMSGGQAGMTNMAGMLMPMMMMSQDPTSDTRLEKMIPMMLMMNTIGGGAATSNPMMPMMMMSMMGGGNFFD